MLEFRYRALLMEIELQGRVQALDFRTKPQARPGTVMPSGKE